jgi:small basic protein
MIWLLSLFGLAIGVLLGLIIPWQIPLVYGKYSALLILAVADTVLSGLQGLKQEVFSLSRFVGGFFALAGLGLFLVWFGGRLGVDFFPGVAVVFCLRLFGRLPFR